jgi:hypothetical protein
MRKLLSLFAIASQLFGYTSIKFLATDSANMTVPNNAPFLAVNNYRVVARFHDLVIPASGSVTLARTNVWGFIIRSDGALCGNNFIDGEPGRGNNTCIPYITGMDVTLRLQRLAAYGFQGSPGAQMMDAYDNIAKTAIISNINGSSVQVWGGVPIDTVVANRNAVGTNAIGSASGTVFNIAFLKWFSTTVPPGTPMFENESTAADVSDQLFEGNTNNQVASSITMSSLTGGITFPASPTRIPTCQVPNQTFRATFPAILVNYSYPLNGDAAITKQYWYQTAGTSARFSSPTSATPTVNGGIAGSPNVHVHLTVYDSSGTSAACDAIIGFVATDSNYVITTGNPQKDLVTGPAILMGKGPLSYLDQAEMAESALQIGLLASNYGGVNPTWQTPGPGTITITQGSANVTGVSTTFQTTFCGGLGNTVPLSDAVFVIWHPSTTAPSGFGRRRSGISSCTDQTHLVLSAGYNLANFSQLGPINGASVSSIQYNLGSTANEVPPFFSQNSRDNFYESNDAFFNTWARTGFDDNLTAFNTIMKNWMDYVFDWGDNYLWGDSQNGFDFNGIYWCPLAIANYAMQGNPNAWLSLEKWETNVWSGLGPHVASWTQNFITGLCGEVCDNRNTSYDIRVASVVALLDPNTGPAATARGHLATMITAFGNTKDLSGLPNQLPYGNIFYYWGQGGGQIASNSWDTGSTVSCIQGQSFCTCASGTCNFLTAGGPSAPLCNNFIEWGFTKTGTSRPQNNGDLLQNVYVPPSCTATQLNLDRPFVDVSGTYGWSIGAPNPTIFGFGTQPYESGMLVDTLDLARQALKCTGGTGVPTNCSDTLSANILTYEKAITDWLQANSYNTVWKAPYYLAGFVNNCLTPFGDTNPNCTTSASLTAPEARQDSGPLVGGLARGYLANPSAGLLAFGDLMANAIFSRPGFTTIPGQTTDLLWANAYDYGYGGNLAGALPQGSNMKGYGMVWGHGHNPAWLGARLGGLQSPQMVTVYVDGKISQISGATKMQVIVTESTGIVDSPVVCTSSPCAVSINRALGNANITVHYLNSSNVVVGAGVPFPISVQ